ncbi:hypothetical protein [Parasphingorhabdus sp.]|uniref:hypothetical protein n=1 Tax=Parasphingorhabdus sp. TaxID=2709688 RepID=UPI0032EC28D7
MTRFLCSKAVVVTQLTVFLAACTSQTAPDSFDMAIQESTEIISAADTRPVLLQAADHRTSPSTHAAIGEFADRLRGEPIRLGYEAKPD